MRLFICITLCSVFSLSAPAQRTDTLRRTDGHSGMVHQNIPKSRAWGNSTYIAVSHNISKLKEVDINLGRTLGQQSCGGAGCSYTTRSYGIGYGTTTGKEKTNSLGKLFYEFTFFYVPPLSAGMRAEYIYDFTTHDQYIRPAAGLSLLYVDVFYNYSFPLKKNAVKFGHGVSFRIKYFHKKMNWMKVYPINC